MSKRDRDRRWQENGRRGAAQPTKSRDVVPSLLDRILGAYADPETIDPHGEQARERRSITEWIELQIQKCFWRAERRAQKRRLPRHVRQSVRWIQSQRRTIAHELTRSLRERGAGVELTLKIVGDACRRFPRDGIVLDDVVIGADRPRARGESLRQRGRDPRTRGESPRQRGVSPRQLRKKAPDFNDQAPIATPLEPLYTAAAADPAAAARPIEELAPGWNALKDQMFAELKPHERRSARTAARIERERLENVNRPPGSSPTTR